MTPPNYQGTFPVPVPATTLPSIQSFLASFYRLSDAPEHNAEWTQQFTDDATVQIGSRHATGREGK